MRKPYLRRLPLLVLTLAHLASAAACDGDDSNDILASSGRGGRGGSGGRGGAAGSGGGTAGSNGGTAGSSGGSSGSGGSSDGGSAGAPTAPSWRVDVAFGDEGLLDLGELGKLGEIGEFGEIDTVSQALEVANLSDGGFVVFNRDRGWLSRFLPDGRRDDAFGWDGVLTLAFSPFEPEAMVVLRDGHIVVGGHSKAIYPARARLARFTARGEFDLEFGQDGIAELLEDPPQGLYISALAEQPDGKIVGTGRYDYDYGVVTFRATRGGALDPTFYYGGTRVWFEMQLEGDRKLDLDVGRAVFPTLDGTLIVAGTGTVQNADLTTPLGTDFTLFSHSATDIDVTFGSDGVVTADAGPASADSPDYYRYDNRCLHAARLADGRIVIAGERGFERPDWVVTRYLPDGTPDPSFAGGGFFVYSEIYYERDVYYEYDDCTLAGLALAPDGSVLLAGVAVHQEPYYGEEKGLLVRLLPNGRIDPAFGTRGAMTPTLLGRRVDTNGDGVPDDKVTYQPRLTALVARDDGSFLVGARSDDGSGQHLFRLLPP